MRIALACLGCAIPAMPQTESQQYVFAVIPAANSTSQIVGFSKNGANGALSPVPGTPLADRFEGGPTAIDALGRFLFILNRASNNISMPPVGGFSQTVSAGQAATYNLQLLGGAGFSGSVTFVCAGAPAKATCNAPTAQIAGGKTNTVAVTISTTASSLVVLPIVQFLQPNPVAWILVLLVLGCWLVLLKELQRVGFGAHLQRTYATLTVVAVLFCVAGCAGAAGPLPQTQPVVRTAGTPQGRYTLTLTPTVVTASQQQLPAVPPITLTLVVD